MCSSAVCWCFHNKARHLLQSDNDLVLDTYSVGTSPLSRMNACTHGCMYSTQRMSGDSCAGKACLHDGFWARLRTQLKGHGARAGRGKGPLVPAPTCPSGLCQTAYRPWLVDKVFIQDRHVGLLYCTHAVSQET